MTKKQIVIRACISILNVSSHLHKLFFSVGGRGGGGLWGTMGNIPYTVTI